MAIEDWFPDHWPQYEVYHIVRDIFHPNFIWTQALLLYQATPWSPLLRTHAHLHVSLTFLLGLILVLHLLQVACKYQMHTLLLVMFPLQMLHQGITKYQRRLLPSLVNRIPLWLQILTLELFLVIDRNRDWLTPNLRWVPIVVRWRHFLAQRAAPIRPRTFKRFSPIEQDRYLLWCHFHTRALHFSQTPPWDNGAHLNRSLPIALVLPHSIYLAFHRAASPTWPPPRHWPGA